MASLLKRVLDSLSNSKLSNTNFTPKLPSSLEPSTGMGPFDRLPEEIVAIILENLGPKDAAKLTLVCKAWRALIVTDDRLWVYFLQNHNPYFNSPTATPSWGWDSILFSEIHLRSGHPLQAFPPPLPPVSFMDLYGHRARVPGAVLIDVRNKLSVSIETVTGGSGYCKFGRSKYPCPPGRSATFLEFGNIESPMYARLRHFFSTIYGRMKVKASTQPVVVSIPICHYDDTANAKASRKQLKHAIYTTLFDMNVPAVCAVNQATLALYAAKQTSGIVVNIGFNQTSIVPILHGKIMHKVGVETIGVGALKVTGFLREQMQLSNIRFESLYTIRELKENLCYVAYDYEAELLKDTTASYEVSEEGLFTLSKERFKAGEILFQPCLAGLRAMALQQAVALCMDHCLDAEITGNDSWFKTIVLCGGTACLPGLPERLGKELHGLLPPSVSNGVQVVPPPYGADSAWFGAKLISNLSTFPGSWCMTKKRFRRKYRKSVF